MLFCWTVTDHLVSLHRDRVKKVFESSRMQYIATLQAVRAPWECIWILISNRARCGFGLLFVFFLLCPRCEINIVTFLWDTKKGNKQTSKQKAPNQIFLLSHIHLFCFSERLSLQIVHCWSLSDFFESVFFSVIIITTAMQGVICIQWSYDNFQLWKC